jgi:putative flippase GtrA
MIFGEYDVNWNQLKRFIMSGGGATLLHLSSMTLLVWLGANAIFATAFGMVLGAVVNYIFQYYYTFDSNTQHHTSIFKYCMSVALSFASNMLLFTLFYTLLHFNAFVSQFLTSALVAIQNYCIYKKFVFLRNVQ